MEFHRAASPALQTSSGLRGEGATIGVSNRAISGESRVAGQAVVAPHREFGRASRSLVPIKMKEYPLGWFDIEST